MTEATTPVIDQRHIESQFGDDPSIVATATASGAMTIRSINDVPESLRWVSGASSGLLFWHHPLGGGAPVPQIRPDVPDGPKYVLDGDKPVVSIHPVMQARLDADVDRTCRVLIQEGTKQMLFAATYAPADVIVVGIQGCWGFSKDKMALSCLDDLVKSRAVTVCFDADISSNHNVYAAAESLSSALITVGAASVKFINVPGGRNIGLDDYLTHRAIGSRNEPMSNLIDTAVPFKKIKKPPRQSARVDTNEQFAYISEELGEVVLGEFERRVEGKVDPSHEGLAVAGELDGRRIRRVGTLLTCAPRITTMVVTIDPLDRRVEPAVSFDIEIQMGPASNPKMYYVKDVASSNLVKFRMWLDRAGPEGTGVSFGPAGMTNNGPLRIESAMRDAMRMSDVEVRTMVTNTGWYADANGHVSWVDAGGAHGENGKVENIKGKLEGPAAGVDIPGFFENYTIEDARESLRKMIGVLDYLRDPTPWVCLVSGLFSSLTGANPEAVLYLSGLAGSGKSSILGTFASILGTQWGTGKSPMASIEGTTAYLSDLTTGIHHCPIAIDDARQRSSLHGQESQDMSLDALIRIGYTGGAAARGRKVVDANGVWRQSTSSPNRPFVIIAGEALPDSAPLSTVERCFVVDVKAETSMLPVDETPDGVSGLEHLVQLSDSGDLRAAISFYLYRTAVRFNEIIEEDSNETRAAVVQDIFREIEEQRRDVAKKAMEKHWPKSVPISSRARNVTATFLEGAARLLMLAGLCEAISEEEMHRRVDEWHSIIINAAVGHSQKNLQGASETQTIIQTITGAIASGKYCLGPAQKSETCIGKEVLATVGGERVPCVALIPKVVAEVLKTAGSVERRFAEVLIPDKDGNRLKVVNMFGKQQRCIVVRASDMWPSGTDDDDESSNGTDSVDEDF